MKVIVIVFFGLLFFGCADTTSLLQTSHTNYKSIFPSAESMPIPPGSKVVVSQLNPEGQQVISIDTKLTLKQLISYYRGKLAERSCKENVESFTESDAHLQAEFSCVPGYSPDVTIDAMNQAISSKLDSRLATIYFSVTK